MIVRTELDRLCDRIGIRASSELTEAPEWFEGDEWSSSATWWSVTLRLDGRRLTVPFGMGAALVGEPTPADVVSSLVLDARSGELSFHDFCEDFGYDEDSRRAERTWRQCAAMAPKVRRLLGEHFDELEGAEH